MQVKQRLKILFFRKRSKQNQDGSPVYARITIDGLTDEVSLQVRVKDADWDLKTKSVFPTAENYRTINDRINAARVDIQRYFDLIRLTKGLATPEDVKAAYLTPINGKAITEQKTEYEVFQEAIVGLMWDYVKWCERWKTYCNKVEDVPPIKLAEHEREIKDFDIRIHKLDREAFRMYGDPTREKTLIMAIDELLFNFLKAVHTQNRAFTTLEKWLGRRLRYIAYLEYRYRKSDIPLSSLKYAFIGDMVNYNQLIHHVDQNTAMNYAKYLKEVIDRAVVLGWLPINLFKPFSCSYVPPKAEYLTMEQFLRLKDTTFDKPHLNIIRDLYVFACYTGLSYAELFRLSDEHLKKIDGQLWIDIARLKTGSDEPVPLLPPAIEIIQKYKDHPQFVRKRRVLPMPTNEHWNRCLKVIGDELKYNIDMHGHQTRYFFINELAYANGVSVPVIKQVVGHKKQSTTEHYLRSNKKRVTQEMGELKEKLFADSGTLKSKTASGQDAASVLLKPTNTLRVIHLQKK
ncbi:site-specific integrase [Paraflavitalea sp. CAU 1676]|uniref:site-specific integrase n=1 Tax=Paraflavitalea sp. CAU 1676 TaxID=3032598 RepID=UPI0023DB1732|nr:site-specific integrase [Paraflavitalea sp. CAU 1676]MDF2191399.1 site-specific integrase [Paraflavitalea sp. CAU 1676]